MNDKDRRRHESCTRSVQFGIDYASGMTPGSKIAEKFALLGTLNDEAEVFAGQQAAAAGTSASEFEGKDFDREGMADILTAVANAARAAEPDHPGYQARFRYDRNLNDVDTVATANSFLAATPTEVATLIDYTAPIKWVDNLTTAVVTFNTGSGAATTAFDSKVATTAEIRAKVNEEMRVKRTIHYMVKNVFAGNVGALAAWRTASHVEADPTPAKKKDDKTDGSSDGTPPTP